MNDHHSFSVWEYSAFVFAVVLVSKLISKKTSTVDVLWLIIAGAVLTNLGFLPKHHEFLETIGEWGIVFIMFALGLEEDVTRFSEGLKKSMGVALIGAIFPFIAGYGTAIFFDHSHNSAMLWGLTMTATAVSLTMMSLRSDLLHKSTAATGIMTAAVVDDVLSLVGVAILIPLILVDSTGSAPASLIGINTLLLILLKVVLFFATILFIGLIAFPDRAPEQLPPKPGLLQIIAYRFSRIFAAVGIRNLLLVHRGEFTPLIMLFIAMLFGVISFKFGFHPAIGAYFAGLFLHKDYFIFKNPKNDEIDETAKGKDTNFKRASHVIEHLAFTIFGPIFFVNLGGKLVFDTAVLLKAVPAVLFLYCTVVILQVLSAMLAARFTGNYKWHESVMIGLGMLGRAELAFIVINIAYVQNKIIDLEQFYTLMFVTFLLNITVPISLKLWKPYYLGFKQLSVLGVKLSRAEPAPIPKHMQEHHKVMAEEKSKYI